MIRINLLPAKGSSGSASSASAGFGGISLGGGSEGLAYTDDVKKDALVKLVILLLGPIALYFYEANNIPGIVAQVSQKQQVLDELKVFNEQSAASVAEIKKFKENEAQIESRISALEKISHDRFREVKIMDLFQAIMPERAWLTRMSINADKLEIRGLAMSDSEVSFILDSLTKSVLVMDVKLVDSSEVEQDGIILKRFEISCSLEKSDG